MQRVSRFEHTSDLSPSLCHKDVVDRDMYQFHNVANGAHDDEADTHCLRYLDEFPPVGWYGVMLA